MKSNPGVCNWVVVESMREFSESRDRRQLERSAYKLCGNDDAAQELLQETYYRALKGPYEPCGAFAGWLQRILKNIFFDSLKRASRRDVPLHEQPLDEQNPLLARLPDGSAPLDAELERAEARGMVRAALAALPEHHRELVELCDLDGASYEDAARQFGLPLGTVRSRLSRARASLRESLGSY